MAGFILSCCSTADMRKELETTSLYNAVKHRCDLINDECVNQQMGYIPHRTIHDLSCEILDLIELDKHSKKKNYRPLGFYQKHIPPRFGKASEQIYQNRF